MVDKLTQNCHIPDHITKKILADIYGTSTKEDKRPAKNCGWHKDTLMGRRIAWMGTW
jgi:hypothetical protein